MMSAMKTRIIILMLLVAGCTTSFAQKKSTCLISPLSIECRENESIYPQLQKDPIQSPKEEKSQEQSVSQQNIKEVALKKYNEDNQTNKDMCYVAYLMKVELFNNRYMQEIKHTYDMVDIQQLIDSSSAKELKNMSNGYNKSLGKYRK